MVLQEVWDVVGFWCFMTHDLQHDKQTRNHPGNQPENIIKVYLLSIPNIEYSQEETSIGAAWLILIVSFPHFFPTSSHDNPRYIISLTSLHANFHVFPWCFPVILTALGGLRWRDHDGRRQAAPGLANQLSGTTDLRARVLAIAPWVFQTPRGRCEDVFFEILEMCWEDPLNVAVLIEIEVESGQILFHHYADGDKMSQDMFTVLLKARDRLPCPTGSP